MSGPVLVTQEPEGPGPGSGSFFATLQDGLRGARKSLIGASFMIVQPLLLNAISLPVTAYIISTLGASDYGHWAVALTLMTTSSVLTNLGLRSYFVRAIAQQPKMAQQAFSEQLALRALLAVVAGLTAIGASYALDYPTLVHQCTAVLAVGAIFTSAANVVSDLLQANEQLPSLATINFISGLLPTAASVVVMWFRMGPMGLSFAYLVGPLVTGVLSVMLVHRRYFPVRAVWSPPRFWLLLKQSRVLALQYVVGTLGNHAENLLVPKLVGLAPYGYFAAGTLLPRRMEVIPDGLNTAFYPVMARTYAQSTHQATTTVKRLGLFQAAACVPPAILVFMLADPIARLLFAESHEMCQAVIQITIWWVPLVGLEHAMGYAINAAGREKAEARIGITTTLLALALSVTMINFYGLIGACLALVGRPAIGLLLRIPTFISTLTVKREAVAAAGVLEIPQ